MAPTTVTMASANNAHNLASALNFTGGPINTRAHQFSAGVGALTSTSGTSTMTKRIFTGTSYRSTAIPAPNWTAGRVSFRNLSVWAYLALGVIIVAVAIVLGYGVYSCCRTAIRVPSTDDDETENGNGNGGEDGDGKALCCPANRNVVNVNDMDTGPRTDGTERTSLLGWTRPGRQMKTVTPPRRNRNGWHANDCAETVYSYPYALDCDGGNPRTPPPAYVRSRVMLERVWRDPKLSPVGGSLV